MPTASFKISAQTLVEAISRAFLHSQSTIFNLLISKMKKTQIPRFTRVAIREGNDIGVLGSGTERVVGDWSGGDFWCFGENGHLVWWRVGFI
jgi:hypothetical protein